MKHTPLKQNLSFTNSHQSGNGTAHFDTPATIFSTRRVWVKRPNGTPTTLNIHQNDIVDDLKALVIAKYPTTLARKHDPADLVIKVDATPKQNPINRLHKNHLNDNKKELSPVSPVPLSASKNPLLQKHSNTSDPNIAPKISSSPAVNHITLEPDQIVWKVLDQYFPNGMQMADAFIIDTPTEFHHSSPGIPLNNNSSTHQSLNTYPNANIHSNSRHHSTSSATYSSAFQNNIPQPSEIFLPSSQSFPHLGQLQGQDHSASPGMRRSPAFSSHRRLQSTSHSPSSTAVLLLPKNFTLANTDDNKKRYSLDDSISRRNAANNITNIKDTKAEGSEIPLNENYSSFNSIGDNTIKSLYPVDTNLPPAHELFRDQIGSIPEASPVPTTTISNNMSDSSEATLIPSTIPSSDSTLIRPPVTNKPAQIVSSKKIPIKPPKTTTEKVLPSINVLVVEDNTINQAILGAFLRKHKIRYKMAKNGQEAIEKWRDGGFHLVLMDIQLPVMSGIQATKEIRRLEKINKIGVFSQPEFSSIPEVNSADRLSLSTFRSPVIIVALTASTSSADRKEALTAGCNDYLTKPVNLVWLQNKITEWGCMQALIDFDGWQIGERNRERHIGSNILSGRTKSISRKNRIAS